MSPWRCEPANGRMAQHPIGRCCVATRLAWCTGAPGRRLSLHLRDCTDESRCWVQSRLTPLATDHDAGLGEFVGDEVVAEVRVVVMDVDRGSCGRPGPSTDHTDGRARRRRQLPTTGSAPPRRHLANSTTQHHSGAGHRACLRSPISPTRSVATPFLRFRALRPRAQRDLSTQQPYTASGRLDADFVVVVGQIRRGLQDHRAETAAHEGIAHTRRPST